MSESAPICYGPRQRKANARRWANPFLRVLAETFHVKELVVRLVVSGRPVRGPDLGSSGLGCDATSGGPTGSSRAESGSDPSRRVGNSTSGCEVWDLVATGKEGLSVNRGRG
jgi:hypothetical protein